MEYYYVVYNTSEIEVENFIADYFLDAEKFFSRIEIWENNSNPNWRMETIIETNDSDIAYDIYNSMINEGFEIEQV
jgi:hypothetical protein|tara:strand:+ start:45 stop:272 length:228 start_codon:yes stop_codon:yes gene_type:complete